MFSEKAFLILHTHIHARTVFITKGLQASRATSTLSSFDALPCPFQLGTRPSVDHRTLLCVF